MCFQRQLHASYGCMVMAICMTARMGAAIEVAWDAVTGAHTHGDHRINIFRACSGDG